eukprot:TRINITY_DN1600_c0_g1_i1.p1 TRINITY_DN1600_c0_g1~~TRINITY_DN1600_c0_g1_i1.p1  ORF type:complete len:438 (+),score=117.92 TRINITY_DN1600_c0_g1_i1:394-1707(+)
MTEHMFKADVWFFVVPILAFFVQWFKTMIGMGWGTVLSPILLSLGYERENVTVSLLLVELCTSCMSASFHFMQSNLTLSRTLEKKKHTDAVPGTFVDVVELDPAVKSEDRSDSDLESPSSSAMSPNTSDSDLCKSSDELVVKGEEPELSEKQKKKLAKKAERERAKRENTEWLNMADVDKIRIWKTEKKPTNGNPLAKAYWAWTLVGLYIGRLVTYDVRCIFFLGFIGSLGAIGSCFLTVYSKKGKNNDDFKFGVKIYIGVMVMSMGLFTFTMFVFKPKFKFAWWKIFIISLLSGFNKGLSGGGSGPVAVTGQMLSGRPQKSSIAVTPFSEIIVCTVSSICYFTSNMILCRKDDAADGFKKSQQECLKENKEYYMLVPFLLVGAVLSIPMAAMSTSKVKSGPLVIGVSVFTICLGIYSIIQTTLGYPTIAKWPKMKH